MKRTLILSPSEVCIYNFLTSLRYQIKCTVQLLKQLQSKECFSLLSFPLTAVHLRNVCVNGVCLDTLLLKITKVVLTNLSQVDYLVHK